MHDGTSLCIPTNAKAPVFFPCVMPSFCAFSGAMSPFVMMPFVNLILDNCVKAHTFTVTQTSLRMPADAHSSGPDPLPGSTRRWSSEIPCPCYSAFNDGRHDAAITQHGRLQQHEKLDRRR